MNTHKNTNSTYSGYYKVDDSAPSSIGFKDISLEPNKMYTGFVNQRKSEIWISDDYCYCTKFRFSVWHRFWAKVLLGWNIKNV